MSRAKSKTRELKTIEAELTDLSNQAAKLHKLLSDAELELDSARGLVSEGRPGASDRLAEANQQVAKLREEQRQVEGRLVSLTQERDRAALQTELEKSKKDVQRGKEVRQLLEQRQRDAERVQNALSELAQAVEAADETAWQIRRAGGQNLVGDAVGRMMRPESLQRALWWVRTTGDQPLARRLALPFIERHKSFTELDEGARSRILNAVKSAEARPAEIEAKLNGQEDAA